MKEGCTTVRRSKKSSEFIFEAEEFVEEDAHGPIACEKHCNQRVLLEGDEIGDPSS